MFRPQHILHPTDYSDCARHAFAIAVDLARQYGARLLVLHVADSLGPEKVSAGEAGQLQPQSHQAALLARLRQVAPAGGPDVAISYTLTEGDPGTQIAAVADREHCDLIVMGTHGRSALSRFLAGSVTQRVSHLSACALLTVRGPVREDSRG